MKKEEYEELKNNYQQYKVDENKYRCPICHMIFFRRGFLCHVLKQHVNADQGIKNSGGYNGHYSDASFIEKQRKNTQRYVDEKYGEKHERVVTCAKCGKQFTILEREKDRKEKYYCSRSCANSHTVSDEHRKRVSESIKNLPCVLKPCKKCGKEVLVKKCVNNVICSECKEKAITEKNEIKRNEKGYVISGRKLTAEQKMLYCQQDTNESKHYYRIQCKFHFNLSDFPDEFDFSLIEKYGWYKAKNHGNNLNGVSRDHMYSIMEGYRNHVDPKIISHPANCRLVQHNDNVSKLDASVISLEDLLKRIEEWDKKYKK